MRIASSFSTAFLVLCVHSAAPAGEHETSAVNLFDGKSLEGWEYFLVDPDVKMEDVWKVKEGLLICKGEPMGYLSTKKEFTNYRLSVEWRWAPGKKPGNSGVLLRITGKPMHKRRVHDIDRAGAGRLRGLVRSRCPLR